MSIDIKTVEKLAELSRLNFSEEHKAEIAEELNKILGFVSQLQEVDTEGVEAMSSAVAATSTPERDDEITAEDKRDNYLKTAPNADMGFFVVPKVIE